MATGWMKSLQCKSKALDDVIHNHHLRRRRHHHHRHSPSNSSSSCKNSVQSLKDVVEAQSKSKSKKKPPEPGPVLQSTIKTRFSSIPSLLELPEGHPSRNVVEIIFHSGWGEKDFSGRVEMVFKVQNMTRTVNRFEEYREAVKSRARGGGGEDHARCVADGNEVMRFYCLGATTGTGAPSGGAWGLYSGGKVCMYSGSGAANESVDGGGGRRAMLVCRVIAGRVCEEVWRIGFDSVSRKNGELTILDRRALLPCFLIIYNRF